MTSVRRRILLSRETLIGLLVVLLATAICVALGLWQYGRFEDRRDATRVIEANYDAAPVPLRSVLPTPQSALPRADDWTPVRLQGRYCTQDDCVVYVRNRTQGGDVGFWQLAPFEAEDGTVLLVVRGWVPSQSVDSAPADPPPVPEGPVEVTVRLRPAEPVLEGRQNPPGQAHSVHPAQIAGALPESELPAADLEASLVTGAYGALAEEQPAQDRPLALSAPDTSLGPHLSYAFQWWIFALFFPAALIYRTRQLIREEAEGTEDEPTGTPGSTAPAPPTRTRRPSRDEEEEDELIDRQGS